MIWISIQVVSEVVINQLYQSWLPFVTFLALLPTNKVNGEANRDCHKSFESVSSSTTTPSLLPSLAHTDTSLPPSLLCSLVYTTYTFPCLHTFTGAFLPQASLSSYMCMCPFSLWVSQRFWHAHTAQKNYSEGWVTSISKDVQSCAQFKGHTFYSPVILSLIALLQYIKASSRYSQHAGRYNSVYFIERE